MNTYAVIGHSSGIGKAISENLGTSNRVYGTYNTNEINFPNQNISSHQLNVLDEDFSMDFLPEKLDGLVYCPGSITLKPFSRFKQEDFLNDYRLQVLGAVSVIQKCLPKLKKSDQASIVLFSTVAVQSGFNFHSLVSANKGAIEGLTKSLSAELAPSIRVNCLAPSITQTPLSERLLNTEEKVKANAKRHPLQSIGQPEDIANLASFLLTEKSKWITGQIIHIDGGMSSIRG